MGCGRGLGAQQYSFFGTSVAVSGKTVVVGTPGYNNNGNDAPSALYVFEKASSGAIHWTSTVSPFRSGETILAAMHLALIF